MNRWHPASAARCAISMWPLDGVQTNTASGRAAERRVEIVEDGEAELGLDVARVVALRAFR